MCGGQKIIEPQYGAKQSRNKGQNDKQIAHVTIKQMFTYIEIIRKRSHYEWILAVFFKKLNKTKRFDKNQ